jgi:hypothetical protein
MIIIGIVSPTALFLLLVMLTHNELSVISQMVRLESTSTTGVTDKDLECSFLYLIFMVGIRYGVQSLCGVVRRNGLGNA